MKKYILKENEDGSLETIFGKTYITPQGYHVLTHGKYRFKKLHRVIFEDYFGGVIPENHVIHHIDKNKLNNNIDNLMMLHVKDHNTLHHKSKKGYWLGKKNKKLSQKMMGENNQNYGKDMSGRNNSCFKELISIRKRRDNSCKQGFIYYSAFSIKGDKKYFCSVSLDTLKDKLDEFINSEANISGYVGYELIA